MKQENKITYDAPIHVEVGDVFYKIESGDCVTFREPCKVCNDTHKVTVNGVTFNCPVCRTGINSPELIDVSNYVVRKYRVSAIEYSMQDRGDWKDNGCRKTNFKLYHKEGRGYGFSYSINVWDRDLDKNLNVDYAKDEERDTFYFYNSAIYSDYKLACIIAARLNSKEMQKLADYNRDYGSNYIFEPKQKNDTRN